MRCTRLARLLKCELHWTKLVLRDKDWRSLSFTPWLPYNWWQCIYIIARWIIALYYLAWLVFLFSDLNVSTAYQLIYLTIWGFITWSLYLLISAVSCTFKIFLCIIQTCRRRNGGNGWNSHMAEPNEEEEISYEVVSWEDDQVAWYQKVQWVFFTLGATMQISIVILYWSLLFPLKESPEVYNAPNLNTHLSGGIVAIIDTFVNGITISIYHVYWPIIYGIVYLVFTGVYYVGGGTDPQGNAYIYYLLDYNTDPGRAVGASLASAFILVPLVHTALYLLSCLRRWLASRLQVYFRKGGPCCSSPPVRGGPASEHENSNLVTSVRYSTLKADADTPV